MDIFIIERGSIMKKKVAAGFKQAVIITLGALLCPLLSWGAEKTSLSSGDGLSPATWTALSGTGTITNDGTALIVGTGTAFQTELAIGSIVLVNGSSIGTVAAIADNFNLTLNADTHAGFGAWAFTHQTLPFPADNVTIQAGHSVTILGSSGLTVTNLTIAATGTMTSDCPALNVAGNIVINGSFVQNPGCRVIMNGTASTIGGTASPITFRSVRLVGALAHVSLLVPVVITDMLDIQEATLDLNSQTLTLGTGIGATGVYAPHGTFQNVDGPGTFTRWFGSGTIPDGGIGGVFPTTAGGVNRNVSVSGDVTAGGTISVSQTESAGQTPITLSENGINFDKRLNLAWAISIANGFAATAPNLSIQAGGMVGVGSIEDLGMCGAAGAANGTYAPTTGTIAAPVVHRSFADQSTLAGTYYVAASSGSPMPVEISAFSAAVKGRTVTLQWTTATEKNNFGFEIERRMNTVAGSGSAAAWTKIGFAEGHGTTNSPQAYVYADNDMIGSCAYRLKQIDHDGRAAYSNPIEVSLVPAVGDYSLTQNYPNPFNPSTNIQFMLHGTQHATLIVYNVVGHQVATLFDGVAEGNTMHHVVFDASKVSSGMYFYTLRSAEKTEVRKMQLLR
jgi:hypothetical protein